MVIFYYEERSVNVVQKKLPLINSAHGSETRNIINELINLFNAMGYTYNESLIMASDILKEAKKTNDMNKSVQNQINTLIAESGTSDAEVLQARTDLIGVTHDVLKTRLDNSDERIALEMAQSGKIAEQVDFVSDLEKMASPRKMSFEKIPTTVERFKINIPLSDNDGIAYYFQENINDDFIMLLQGVYGNITKDLFLAEKINYQDSFLGDKPGSGYEDDYNNNSPNHFTKRVDEAYISAIDLYGTKITFNHFADNRGGIWEFIVDEGTGFEQSKKISVFSSTAATKETTVFENLDLRNHTIKGIFRGADPNNPPTGAARGWIYFGGDRPQDKDRTFHVYRESSSVDSDVPAMYSYSNKEFAVRLRPVGSTLPHRYIPEHEGMGTAFNKVDRKLLLDGEEIDFDTVGYVDNIDTVQLIQIMYGYYPSDLNNPMIEVHCQHTIKNGVVSVNGRIKFLQDADVTSMSSILTPYYLDFAKKILTSLGNVYQTKDDGSNEYWDESDKFKSLAFINDEGNQKSNVAMAVAVDNVSRTYRYNKEGRGTPFSWIEHRNSSLGKIYNRPLLDYQVDAGFEYKFDGRFIVTKIDGIRDYLL